MDIESVQKVSRSGNSLIINIPKKICDVKGFKLGDYIQVVFKDIVKTKRKELPKL